MEPCKYEREIGALIEASRNFKEFMRDLKENHLASIYKKLEIITEKMSSRRPSWTVVWIITSLTTLCGILTTILLRK